MKKIFPIIIVLFFITAFNVAKNSVENYTQVVITVPDLNSIKLQKYLEKDLNKISGVIECTSSLQSKTFEIKFDDAKTNISKIKKVLEKWDCTFGELSLININSSYRDF